MLLGVSRVKLSSQKKNCSEFYVNLQVKLPSGVNLCWENKHKTKLVRENSGADPYLHFKLYYDKSDSTLNQLLGYKYNVPYVDDISELIFCGFGVLYRVLFNNSYSFRDHLGK